MSTLESRELPSVKYIHEDAVHNMQAPDIIVPVIVDLLKPESVVDIGCGLGTFLHAFEKRGIKILGVDGHWVNKDKLFIVPGLFKEADLEKPVVLDEVFDLVVCLEVVEHLSPDAADTIVESLVNAGRQIVFSAAIPNQGGQNHVNEQPTSYWQKKFEKHNFFFYDVFRPVFWNTTDIAWWYKQNMYLVVHESVNLPQKLKDKKITGEVLLQIHPDLYEIQIKKMNTLTNRVEYLNNQFRSIKSVTGFLKFYSRLVSRKFLGYFKKNTGKNQVS